MRLLIYGSRQNTNTIGSFIVRHFDGSFEYDILDFPDTFAGLLKSNIYKVIYRIFPLLLVRKMDLLFLKQVDTFRPTVVLIFKGMEISKWSLKKVKRKGIKLVNYNFDHPFEYFSKGTGNRFVKEAIPFYDLHISYSAHIAKELQHKFNVKSAWIPFGYHITENQFNLVKGEDCDEIVRVCFVGNPDRWRIDILRKLLRDGIAIDLYGFGWENSLGPHELLTIHQPRRTRSFWEDPNEFWKVLRKYRVQLNFFRPHNEGSHNLRTFEVPAVGGILLTPESEEQALFFEEDKEIFFYKEYETLVNKCRWLLGRESAWIQHIRSNARARSLAGDYSYERRTKDLLLLLEKI